MTAHRRKKSIAVPEKRPYRRSEFVGRRKELSEVAKRVTEGKKDPDAIITLPVLNFWGIQGSGKSWFVRHLARRYRGPGKLKEGECKRTFTALLDFADFDSFEWTVPNLAALLKPVAEDILEQTEDVEREEGTRLLARLAAAAGGGDGDDDEKDEDDEDDEDEKEETADTLAQAFVDWVIEMIEHFVPIVLLDTVENVTQETLDQIELNLIEPLARTGQVVLVTAGRREVIRWRRHAVRSRQAKSIQMKAFTPSETARQVKKQGFELPGDLVYDYSFGLAYASQVMAHMMSELANGHKVNAEFLQEHEDLLGKWLDALDRQLLRPVPENLQPLFHVICVPRFITEDVLSRLLPSKDEEDYRSLLDQLEMTRLVWWESMQRRYLMAPSLRQLLGQRLRIREPRVFTRHHRTTADYYREEIGRLPYDCGPLLIEALYHTAHGYADQVAEKVEDLTDLALESKSFTVGGIDSLWTQLRTDEELREALPDHLTEQALQQIKTLRRKIRRERL